MTPQEINKTVHEGIIGGCWHDAKWVHVQGFKSAQVQVCKICKEVLGQKKRNEYNPNYYEDIADAMKLVERVFKKYCDKDTGEITIHRAKKGYAVYIYKSASDLCVRGESKSLPKAITLACMSILEEK